jgi:hypothetical protein
MELGTAHYSAHGLNILNKLKGKSVTINVREIKGPLISGDFLPRDTFNVSNTEACSLRHFSLLKGLQ